MVVLPLGIGIVMGVLLLNSYGKYFARRRAIEVGLVVLGPPARDPHRRRAAQPVADPGRRGGAPCRPVGAHVARRGRRRDRVPRGRVLRDRGDLGPGPAPGGHPGRCPRPRLRRPEHAHLGGEHPADHHRRADRGHPGGRHDRRHPGRRRARLRVRHLLDDQARADRSGREPGPDPRDRPPARSSTRPAPAGRTRAYPHRHDEHGNPIPEARLPGAAPR